jgi:large subunit ribosomal protein L33
MAKKSDKRKLIGLVCEETGHRHYYSSKNSTNTPDKLRVRKYNPLVRRHTWYVETSKDLGRNVVKPRKHGK